MTRRDTIIVAVLVNAGLLIVVFASALKSSAPEQEFASSSMEKIEQQIELSAKKDEMTSHGDEVDQVLKQYANPIPAAIPAALAQVSESTSQQQNSFADDLRAITLPETRVAPLAQLTAQSSAQSSSNFIDYKVKKGDVLEKIARHHQCAVEEIMKINKLATTNLRIGQTLKIPSKSALPVQTARSTPAAPASSDTTAKYYTVKNGDNPWTIAVKNHMKVEDLLKLNNLDQEKARKLKPGDQLRIN